MPAIKVATVSDALGGKRLLLVELQGKIENNAGDLQGLTIGELSLDETVHSYFSECACLIMDA